MPLAAGRCPRRPRPTERVTIAPRMVIKWGSAARLVRNAPVKFVVSTRLQVSRVCSWTAPPPPIPAL